MRKMLPLALAFGAMVAGSGCAPAPPPAPKNDAPADLAAIAAGRVAFEAGYNAADAEAIGKLYTADAISEPNHQDTLKGRDAIVQSLKGMFEHVSVKASLKSEEVRTSGDTGFDRGTYSVEVTPKAGTPPHTVEGRYLVLYARQGDGSWKVTRDIDNEGAAEAPEGAAAGDAKAQGQ